MSALVATKKWHMLIIILVAVLLVTGLGVAIYYAVYGNVTTTTTTTTTTTATTNVASVPFICSADQTTSTFWPCGTGAGDTVYQSEIGEFSPSRELTGYFGYFGLGSTLGVNTLKIVSS